MRFAVNVSFLFTEVPYLERFERAAAAGFAAVETPWPEHDVDDVAAAVRRAGLELVQINAHAGDLAAGDRGYANDPSRTEQWRTAVQEALLWSTRTGRPAVNLLVGNRLDHLDIDVQLRTLRENIDWVLPRAKDAGVLLLVEVLNDRDTPDYLLTRLETGADFVRSFDRPELRLQFDTYHVAMTEGSLRSAFVSVADLVGHVQLADAPGRHEPGTGDADLPEFLEALGSSGYAGAVSLEYRPSGETGASLAWLPFGLRSAAITSFDGLRAP